MTERTMIPESGKPQDLDFEDITSIGLANVAESWLDDMVENMRLQVEHGVGDEMSNGRLHSALTKTATRLALVREMKERMKPPFLEAFYETCRRELEPEDFAFFKGEAERISS